MSRMPEAQHPAAADARLIEHAAFKEGKRVSSPTALGIIAWGVVAGMTMVKSGLTVWQALSMTMIVYGGSAIFAALPLMAAHAPAWVILFTATMVNLRFIIFAAVIAPHFAHLRMTRRIWYGYLNSDIAMSYFPQRFPIKTAHQPLGKEGFFTGIVYSGWIFWQIGTVGGILLASQIPESWNIAFAGTLALLALLIPMTLNWAALGGVVAASAVAVLANAMPYRMGLLLAVAAGIATALILDKALAREAA
jgi:predicted branched-subunit amino acid permease